MTFTLGVSGGNVNTINFMSPSSSSSPSSPREVGTKSESYHHGNLREALLCVALAQMSQTGVTQFSLSELARRVGVTPAAAYKHFADKESLLADLARHGFDVLRKRFEAAAPQHALAQDAQQAVVRFERIGQAYVQFGLDMPALFSLVFGKDASNFRKAAAAPGERTPTFAYLATALEELHKFGVIAKQPDHQTQWFAWSAIHGATELHVAGINALVTPDQSAHVVTAHIIRALS
jgi:AcrR family transcriptional regulator